MRLLFLFFIFASAVFAQDIIELKSTTDLIQPGKKMKIYEDKSKGLVIQQVLKPENINLFKTASSDIPNFNVCASAIWSRFIITTKIKENWLLEIGNPNAESVKCYISKKNKLIDSAEFGIHSANIRKALKTYHGFVDLKVQPGDTLEIFVRWVEKTPLHVIFKMGTQARFFEIDHFNNFFHGMIYGIIVLMIIYNLFLALSGSGREYIYYVIYIFFNLLFLLYFTGHVSVLSISVRNFLYVHPVVIPAIFGTFGILFTMEFLQTKKFMPKMHFLMSKFK